MGLFDVRKQRLELENKLTELELQKEKNKEIQMQKEIQGKKEKSQNLSIENYFPDYEEIITNRKSIEQIMVEAMKPEECDGKRNSCCDYSLPNYLSNEFIWRNVVSASYVIQSVTNLVFSNKLLVTGNKTQTEALQKWLKALNPKGVTNFNVLFNAVKYSMPYGRSGIRFLSDGSVDYVPYDMYRPLFREDDDDEGVTVVYGYLVARKEEYKSELHEANSIQKKIDEELKEIKQSIISGNAQVREIKKILSDDNKFVFIPKSDFINLRYNTAYIEGESIFSNDRQELQLIATAFDRLIKDLEDEGFGRILLYQKINPFAEYISDDTDSVNPNASFDMMSKNTNEAMKKYQKNISMFAEELNHSKKDSATVVPANIVDKVDTSLNREFDSTSFLDFVLSSGATMARIAGINPALLGLGELSGNVSMTSILDFSMENSIVPMRNSYSSQISPVLSDKLRLDEISFEDYAEQYVKEEDDHYKTSSETIKNLVDSGMESQANKVAEIEFNNYKGE